jgi:hypothetical protein
MSEYTGQIRGALAVSGSGAVQCDHVFDQCLTRI